ncbi:MAG: enoyl-CoA hydratase/isomerase family protein [Bdellovibrionales bacterium]|nr:enoyl-CoA hydratase/isomerase family protein [Bdellovibrionales bacterium]
MSLLKVTQNLGVRTISLNRPEKRNAFFPEMIQEITKAFKVAAKEKTVRAILLTGEGQSFCSGGDLEWMKSMADYTLKQNVKDAEELFEMYWTIRNTPVPVIGKVFGHAFGGGAGLAAVCDVVAAEEKTQVCFSEVKWGLVPAVISPFVSERAHPAKVREWFTTAKVFNASEALQGGLINFSGSIDQVDGFIEETLKLWMAAAPEALRETKKLHQSYSPINWKQARPKVTKLIAARRVSKEGQKGLKAFLEKRSPKWSDDGQAAQI